MDRGDRAPWPTLRRGRGGRSLRRAPGLAAVAVVLVLLLAGCWTPPPEEATPLPAIPAGEDAAEAPPAEEGAGEEPQVPPQEAGGGNGGGGEEASPGATPRTLVPPPASPRASPGASPRTASPPVGLPPSNPTQAALATRTAAGIPTASGGGGGQSTTRPGLPPLTVADLATAESMGLPVPPPLQTAVAEGTPITVPDLILTAEALGNAVPPALQTAAAQGQIPPELIELLTPGAGTPAPTDGTPAAESTEEAVTDSSPSVEAGTEAATASESPIAPETETATEPATEPATESATEPPLANGSLLIKKTDGAGNAVGGACFTLTGTGEGADSHGPLCDGDDADGASEDGQIQFDGVVPGEYTLAETTTPAGFQTAAAETVLVAPGTEHEVVNAPVPAEVGGIVVPLVDENGAPLVDAAGNALPDACITVEPAEGGSAVSVCDNGENDADSTAGTIRLEGLPAGSFIVSQPQAPAGFQPIARMEAAVVAGEDLTLPPAEVKPAPPAVGGIRALVTDEAGNRLTGACVAVTVSGAADAVRACDNLPEDPDREDGAIGFANLPVGPVQVVEERPPDGYPPATTPEQPIEVVADQTVDVPFSHPAPPEPTPTPQPEATPVVLTAPVAFLNAADEFFVLVPGLDPAIPLGEAGSLDPAVTPAFSVDWRWLAFYAIEPEGLYLFDLTTNQVLPPLDLGVAGRPTDPGLTWSPRGATLAVTVALDAGGSDVVLLDPEAGNPGRVFGDAAPPATIDAVAWDPEGLRLVVVATPVDGAPTVELVDAATLARTPIVVGDGLAADAFYGWSAAGRLLVRADNQLWIVDPAQQTSDSLGEFVEVPVAPAWSADGSAVVFYDAPADDGGQLRIATDGQTCETRIVDVRAIAWRPGGAELAVAGAREDGPLTLEFVGADCAPQTILDTLEQPPVRLVWAADGNNLALISPPSTTNAVEIALLGTNGLFPLDDSALVVGGIFGWTPDQPVLLLYGDLLRDGDPPFEAPPAEARLWAVPAESVLPAPVQGATTNGGYVKTAWPPPRQVEAAEDSPAPRRAPPPPVPDSNGGGAPDAEQPTTGSLEITSVDANGGAISGKCVYLDGTQDFGPVCDDGPYDAVKDQNRPGVIRIDLVPPDTYTVTEQDDGGPPAAPGTVAVVAGQVAPLTLERGEAAPDAPTAGQTGIEATWTDADGNPLAGGCMTLVIGAQGFGPVCDGDQRYDGNPDAGVLRVVVADAGTYTVSESSAPPGYAPATQPTATVDVPAGSVVPIPAFINAPA